MCLITTTNIPKIAEENIPIYKMVVKIHPKNQEAYYRSPYYHKFLGYERDFPLTVTPAQKEIDIHSAPNIGENSKSEYLINSGAIHMYKQKELGILNFQSIASLHPTLDIILLKGYIPKGTEYFEDVSEPTFAAKKIILTEEYVPDNK